MAVKANKVEVWAAPIQDEPGRLSEIFAMLAEAGADFNFALARRERAKPGTGVVFLTPLQGAKQLAAAKAAGFKKLTSVWTVRVEAPNKPGLAAALTRQIGKAGVNLRGLSASTDGKTCVMYLTLDKTSDVNKVIRAVTKTKAA